MLDYTKLPEHIQSGVQGYIEKGRDVGHFLTAVIENNLSQSFGQADEINRARLFDIVGFFYNEAPGECWGSPEKMDKWLAHAGLEGKDTP